MLGVNKTAITKPISKLELTRDTRQLKNSKNSETLCTGKVVITQVVITQNYFLFVRNKTVLGNKIPF